MVAGRIEPVKNADYSDVIMGDSGVFNPTRVEFPAGCGVKEIGNSIPDTPLLAAG